MGGRFGRHRLSSRKVETAAPGIYQDGAGLQLVVKASGRRHWVFRYQRAGKRHDMGLGGFPDVSLARARDLAQEARALLAEGRDPIEARRAKSASKLTFREAAERLIEAKKPGWKSEKHGDQWLATLEQHVFPIFGDRDVGSIETPDILAALKPIWERIPETASRVRQRVEAVLDYARVHGARTGENPARWRGHLEHLLPPPTKVKKVEHFAALPYRDMPEFWTLLAAREGMAAAALRFVILTACRSGEVRGAEWSEVDFDERLWIIRPERMKAGKEHRVPLTDEAMTVLETVRGLDHDLVFPSGRKDKPLSDMALTAVLRRMASDQNIIFSSSFSLSNATVHGFRSSFRDWAGETTSHSREVIEHALAHRLKDKAEAAYQRGDLLAKRRILMEDWARFVTGRTP